MNIRDFRKYIFINSQYCTYYLDQNNTVVAGVLRNNGYKFPGKFSEEQILELEKIYRKCTTLLNCAVGAEIILYLYCVIFHYFIQFLQMPYFLSVLLFSIPPLVALFLTYVVFENIYEKEIKKFGEYEKVKFRPNIYNVEPKAFERYANTPRKSGYILVGVMIIFLFYAFVPSILNSLNAKGKFGSVIKTSSIYLKLIPINSDVYAQRAFAEYKSEKYDKAQKDFELANAYSSSDVYDYDILGSKIKTLSFEDAVKEFDSAIASAEDIGVKHFMMSEKAIFLHQNKDYQGALRIYDSLINAFVNKDDAGFAVDKLYYNRSLIKTLAGDKEGANSDLDIARNMCPNCEFVLESSLVRRP